MSSPSGPPDPFDPRASARPPQANAGDPLVPDDVAGWVARISGVARRSWAALLPLQLAAGFTGLVVGTLAGPPFDGSPLDPAAIGPDFLGTTVLAGLVLVGVLAFTSATSVVLAVRHANGEPTTLADAARAASGRVLPLVGRLLVAGLLVTVGVFLVVPAVYLAVVFGASLYGVVVVERGGIRRCFALVNPRLLPTLGRMLLAVGAYLGFLTVAGVIVSAVGGGSLPGRIAQVLLGAVTGVVGVGVAVVTYAELRARERPGVGTATLAAELG
ncbi:MAG: hypothetical protein ACT4RN_15870 [Pseudonocardia sp.]